MTARGVTTVTVLPSGRMEVADWGLARGCTRVSSQVAARLWDRPARVGDRVHVCGRPFTVLHEYVISDEYALVAQDSAWWLYWIVRARLQRARWQALRPWVRWLYRTGRMESAMDCQVKTVEDLWVRTWWPAHWARRSACAWCNGVVTGGFQIGWRQFCTAECLIADALLEDMILHGDRYSPPPRGVIYADSD